MVGSLPYDSEEVYFEVAPWKNPKRFLFTAPKKYSFVTYEKRKSLKEKQRSNFKEYLPPPRHETGQAHPDRQEDCH